MSNGVVHPFSSSPSKHSVHRDLWRVSAGRFGMLRERLRFVTYDAAAMYEMGDVRRGGGSPMPLLASN